MENRSVGKFIVFSLLTLGIYTIVWFFWTSKELRNAGQEVPTAWLQLIPLANIYFYYKHFAAAEKATNGAVNSVLYLVLGLFVSIIVSAALEQNEFNKIAGAPMAAGGMPNAAPGGMPQQAAPVAPAPTDPAQAAPAAPPANQDVATPAPAPTEPAAPQDPNQQPPAAPPTA